MALEELADDTGRLDDDEAARLNMKIRANAIVTRPDVNDSDAARRTGRLLAVDGSSDVVDASVVDIAQPGDEIVTTDPTDLARLATSAGKSLSVLYLST